MAYDETLADRISAALAGRKGVVGKKMFGGIAFMVNGRMACGVMKDDLMVRVDESRVPALLKKPGARPMDFTRRPMPGFLYVGPQGRKTEAALKFWVDVSAEYALSQPPKAVKAVKASKAAKPAKAPKKKTAAPKPPASRKKSRS
jgi:hypothetical protein